MASHKLGHGYSYVCGDDTGYGRGNGRGDGAGYGDGYGRGDGYGYGDGNGRGNGRGAGHGHGYGSPGLALVAAGYTASVPEAMLAALADQLFLPSLR